MRRAETVADGTDLQRVAVLFGIVYGLVAVLGFIPGITTEYDRLTTFDDDGAKLLGFLGVNVLANVLHGILGLAAAGAAASLAAARVYFLWGGLALLGIWLYGLVIDLESAANVLGLTVASNWLHFGFGVAMVGVGALLDRPAGGRKASIR